MLGELPYQYVSLVLSCLVLPCLVLPCLVCLTLSITINSPAQNSRQARRASMPPVPNAKAPWLQLARQTASRRMSVALLASISCKRTILGRAIQPPVNPPGAEAPLERSRTAAIIHLPRRASVGATHSVSPVFPCLLIPCQSLVFGCASLRHWPNRS